MAWQDVAHPPWPPFPRAGRGELGYVIFGRATPRPVSTTGNRGQPSHSFWSSKKAWEGRPRRLGKIGGLGTL